MATVFISASAMASRESQGAVELLGADHADLFNRGHVASDAVVTRRR